MSCWEFQYHSALSEIIELLRFNVVLGAISFFSQYYCDLVYSALNLVYKDKRFGYIQDILATFSYFCNFWLPAIKSHFRVLGLIFLRSSGSDRIRYGYIFS